MKRFLLPVVVACTLALGACKKDPEVLSFASVSEYAPLAVGKYITYQLDTLSYKNFGTSQVIITYQVKHVVDALITDNLGRPAYRIVRYIRKTALKPWVPDHSFMAVTTANSLEFIENNLRFIKLRSPLSEGYTWKGNTYIDTYSLNSTVRYLDDWDYAYEGVNEPYLLGNNQVDSTVTVNQRDEVIGNPADLSSYSEKNIGLEVYAKGIGMIYRKFLHTEYQPATPGTSASYTDDSYGVTLTMIDHN